MRFRFPNTHLLTIGLSSIALHLAVLSILSADSSQKPIELVYLPTVQIDQQPIHKVSPRLSDRSQDVASGTTSSVDSTQLTQNSFSKLRESLYMELNNKLKNRTKKLELLLSLQFSSVGVLQEANLLKSSGRSEVDSEVMGVLAGARLYSSPDLANLKIQVPLKFR